ncbi:MAG: hypothetical protein HYR67_06805 [Bacteroidetes bacterium]|nr:hypothetical protein [Bacteroidota bacterium]
MKTIKKHGRKMVVAAGAMAAAFAGASGLPSHSTKVKCVGEQRWQVKTLQDETASQINFTPKTIAMADILDKTKTSDWSLAKDDERQQDEFQVFKVTGKIPFVNIEADGDIHIELMDKTNSKLHLVAEIPNPDCEITKGSDYKDMFRKARNEFVNKYQDKSVWSKGTFEITGVLFHDKSNHGTGGNANGVEIHPVINIKKIN